MKNKLFVFSAPSGAGKTTIVRELLARRPDLEFSISACTRQPRADEVNGKDYYFISENEFKQKVQQNEFLEWEEVYKGMFYGTLKSELNRIWQNNHHVVFDIDVVGGLNIKKQYPNNTLAIFIEPPSIDILEQRLKARATDSDEVLAERLNKARFELTYAKDFDLIIVNDNLAQAIEEAMQHVENFLK